MLSFCSQISPAINTSGGLLQLPLADGKWKAAQNKQEVVVGVPESILDIKVLTNGVTSNVTEIDALHDSEIKQRKRNKQHPG